MAAGRADPAATPPAQQQAKPRRRRARWLAFVAGLLFFCATPPLLCNWAIAFAFDGARGCNLPRDAPYREPCLAVVEYIAVIADRDWARAHTYLAAAERATTSPEQLRAAWEERDVRAFRINQDGVESDVREDTARLSGRISSGFWQYNNVGVTLVREESTWRITNIYDSP